MRSHRALILGLLLSLLTSGVRAEYAPPASEWPTERNAQQLRRNEWKLGLFGGDVGLHERLQLGTLWPTWAMLGPNVRVKGLLLARNGWQLGADASFFHVKLDRLSWYGYDELSGRFSTLSSELFVDKQVHPRLLLGLGASYVFTDTSPKYNPESLSGSAAYDSVLMHGQATARASKHLWLVLEVDWILYQAAGGVGAIEPTKLGEYITVSGRARAVISPLEPARAGAATLSLVVRAGRFGMRLGAGYGNFVIPRLGITVPYVIPYGLFDIFARFGGKASAPDARK